MAREAAGLLQELLLRRLHLLVSRLFSMAEDGLLRSAMGLWVFALGGFHEEVLGSLLHVATSLMPVLMHMDPDVVARGLGTLNTYQILEGLWDRVVPCNSSLHELMMWRMIPMARWGA